MKDGLPRWLPAAVLLIPALVTHAQTTDPLPPETALATVSGAPTATEETFSISTSQDLVATFTDLQTPAALSGANVVVTQGASIVATTTLAPPATTATLSLPAAAGEYTLRVIGTPSATFGVGTFSVCVAPKASPTACIQDASLVGNITVQSAAADPTVSTLTTTLTVITGGTYTFTYADDQFPVALNVAPSLALFQGSTPIAAPIPASPAALALSPGTYTLFAIAQADPTAKAGLYGINITGPAGVAPLLSSAFPVGILGSPSQLDNPTAQSLTLKVTDFAFPAALASVSALVTSGGSSIGTASGGGSSVAITAPAGVLQVWSFGAARTDAGTYEIDLTSSSASLLQTATGVSNGSSLAYAFVSPKPLSAGTYSVTGNDFEFPAALQGLKFAAAQNATILQTASAAGTIDITATAAPVVLLVDAITPTNGNGMFDVNVQTKGSSPQIVFDATQGVSGSGVFTTRTINFGVSGNFDVTLADLKFPAQFANLALVLSNDGAVVEKVYGGGTFTFPATPGAYQLNFIAQPGTPASGGAAQYGLYGLQIVNSAPVVTLTASPTTVAAGAATTLTWTSANAISCTGAGGNFVGSQATGSGTLSLVVSATTTYTLTCTGAGGTGSKSVTVTATPATGSRGGGEINWALLGLLGLLAAARFKPSDFHD